jgi:O-antigen/teichoic acid export membrane protein
MRPIQTTNNFTLQTTLAGGTSTTSACHKAVDKKVKVAFTTSENISLKKSLYGAACISAQPLLLNVLSIPVMAYIIRQLGPAAYGQWATSVALIGAGMMLANLGLRAGFVRAVALHPERAPRALAEQLGLRLSLCIFTIGSAFGGCALLGYSTVVLHCTAVGGLGAVATTIATVFADLLQARQRLAAMAAMNLLSGIFLTATSALVIGLGGGPVALAAAYLVGPIISAAGMWSLLRREQFPVRLAWDGRRFLTVLKDARSFAAQQLVAAGGTHVHTLLLSRLVSPAAFGFFAAGSLPGNRLTVIPDGLATAAYPALAQAYRRSPAEAARLASRYLGLTLITCLCAAVAVMLAAGPISRLLFPDHPLICRQVICISVWALPGAGMAAIMGYALNAAGKETEQARALLPAGICTVVITVLLVVCLGLLGACWALIVPHAINALFLLPCFLRTFWSDLPRPLRLSAGDTVSGDIEMPFRKAG